MKHLPHLDALRCVAVLMVVGRHFWPAPTATEMRLVALGALGVSGFFVLSGFLITGILLDARQRAEEAGLNRAGVWGRFWIRRALRIFPLYYGALLAAHLLGVPSINDSAVWNATYTTNLWIARHNEWPGSVSHLWSLAVEEQFYLLWPVVILPTGWTGFGLVTIVTIGLAALSCYAVERPVRSLNRFVPYVR